jgi:predicted NBD/HSP70 family sugar kinase
VSRPASHGDLLELLRRGGPTTRRELLASTGLSRATLWQRIDSLRAQRLVREERGPDGSRGRPAGRLRFDETSRRILVADLGATHATLAVTDLSARRLAVDRRPLDLRDGPRGVLPQVLSSAEHLLRSVPPAARGLLGIGVGFPGLADQRRGAIEAPAVLHEWDGVPLAERFSRAFGAPAVLVNDAHAMAYGEHLADDRRRTLVVVKASTGIGAGLVVDGRLHRGESMGAGQIGHMRLPGARRRCVCGETGCLATVASGRALLRQLRRVRSLADVRDAVEAGDAQAVAAVRTAGAAVGTVLSGIVTAIDPGAVLFGGILGRLEVFVEAARAPIGSHAYTRTAGHVTVGRTVLGEESAVVGLAGLVVDSFLSPDAVDALVMERARSRA